MADNELPEAIKELVAIPCMKCGEPVLVDKTLIPAGANVMVSHEKCDHEASDEENRRFKCLITIYEVFEPTEDDPAREQPVAGFGEEVFAPTFKAALPGLSDALARMWERVQEHAPIADAVAPDDQVPADPLDSKDR